jgi:prophage antirepressor-like protein
MNKYFDFIFDHENLFIIIDNNEKIWFAGNDIAKILDYKAPKKIIEKVIPNKYKNQYQDIDVDNKEYNKKYQNKSIFIDEIGLYRLSIKSKQPKAIRFQEWITDEVLPELRKQGNYQLEEEIHFLKKKLHKTNDKLHEVNKINRKLLIENDYLREEPDEYHKNILYVIRIPTTIRGKYRICYKLGITNDLKRRMRTYHTGNPNIDLLSYFIIKNLDSMTVENCVKSVLKFKELKKNNEIFCESLKNIYKLLDSCIDDGEIVKGICYSCKQKININTLYSHRHCFDKYIET